MRIHNAIGKRSKRNCHLTDIGSFARYSVYTRMCSAATEGNGGLLQRLSLGGNAGAPTCSAMEPDVGGVLIDPLLSTSQFPPSAAHPMNRTTHSVWCRSRQHDGTLREIDSQLASPCAPRARATATATLVAAGSACQRDAAAEGLNSGRPSQPRRMAAAPCRAAAQSSPRFADNVPWLSA